ncbi:alpha/beta hydrolase [Myxococcota bacterium]
MRNIAIILAAGYLIWGITLFSLQRRIIFPRHYAQPLPNAGENVPGLEKIWIESPEGPVESWFLPGDGISPENPGPVVVFAHGNAELIDYWPDELSGYRRMGVSVFLPEYRGYGRSKGDPSQKAITEDYIKFHDQLTKRPDVDKKRIIFHGRSLGGGAVCALAEKRKPAALILMSTFVSVVEMSRGYLIPGFLVRDPFENIEVVKQLDIPILIMHGRHDDLIPYKHAEKLHAAAKNSKLITYECDHNSCPPDWKVFWNDVNLFLKSANIL